MRVGGRDQEESRRTPRTHSRYKSSTRLRWCTELIDEVAARARRVGIVVIVSDNLQFSGIFGSK